MVVYILGTLITLILVFVASKSKNTKNEKLLAFISAVPLTIISGFRYNVGADYYGYTNFFNIYKNNPNSAYISNFEIGFKLMTKIIQLFTIKPMWMFMSISIIISYFIFKAIYEESPTPVLSIFLYISMQFYFYSMNGMRQFIAMSIFLYSIRFIRSRKFFPFLILNLIGMSFHSSALVYLPLYFIYNFKLTPKLSIVLLALGTIFVNSIYKFLLMIVLNTKYSFYIDSQYDTGAHGVITMMIQIFVLIFALVFYRNIKENETEQFKKYNFYCILQLIATYFACIDGMLPLLNRIKISFALPSIILIPMSLSIIKNVKVRFFFKFFIIVSFTIYILYTIGIQNANTVLPYRTIFS